MIPGFNTDFKYRGETYHVQTEDNGASNPVVVTLLYHKGAILASRRTPYRDIVGKPGFEQELMVLMKTQHKDLMKSLLSGSFDKEGAAPAVVGGSGENPAEAAGAIVETAAHSTVAAAAVPPAISSPASVRRAAQTAATVQKPQPPVTPPATTLRVSPVSPAAAAEKPHLATLDEAIWEYLQNCAATAVH